MTQLNCFNLPEYPDVEFMHVDNTMIKKVKPLPTMPKLQEISFYGSQL